MEESSASKFPKCPNCGQPSSFPGSRVVWCQCTGWLDTDVLDELAPERPGLEPDAPSSRGSTPERS
jgi:hypothetical protein